VADIENEKTYENFHALRGKAIDAYAKLDSSLFILFVMLGEIRWDIAGVIYHNIIDTRTRGRILSKLMRKKYKDQYRIFWRSLERGVARITEARNKIVHHVVGHMQNPVTKQFAPVLIYGDVSNFNIKDQPPIDISQIEAFVKECDFYHRLINMFYTSLTPTIDSVWDEATRQSWREIFQQPIVYPPPNNHPLFQNSVTLGSLPPPFVPSPESPPT
jgi:hypothetical protein